VAATPDRRLSVEHGRPNARDRREPGAAHQLSELSRRRRGDPGLGETTETQHGGQVLRVAHVVLHPAVPPVVAEGMGEVHVRPELFEQIGCQYQP
jgi:hypothetical protein